jgi:hypothetical protein
MRGKSHAEECRWRDVNSMVAEMETRDYMMERSKSLPSLVWRAEQLLTLRDVKGDAAVITAQVLAFVKAHQQGMTAAEKACKEEEGARTMRLGTSEKTTVC